MYENLLEYIVEIGIAEAMTLSDIKLVEAATIPDEPDFPKKLLNYIAGVFLGLFWGLVLAFFVEYIDNTVKLPDDIKHIKPLTYLGTIPASKQIKQLKLISNMEPTAHMVEVYRTLKNSIKYASVDKPIKSIVVTSSIEGEGKSTVASNLAITMSMESKRTIIVDFDLRKPVLHKLFNINNTIGVTSVLVEGYRLEDAIVQTGVKGLSILPSGPIPPDPSRLIESKG